jgi:hypothetical protein
MIYNFPAMVIADDFTYTITYEKQGGKPPIPDDPSKPSNHKFLYIGLIVLLVALGVCAWRYKQKINRVVSYHEQDTMSMSMDVDAHKYTY